MDRAFVVLGREGCVVMFLIKKVYIPLQIALNQRENV